MKASVFIIIFQVNRLNINRALGSPEMRCRASWMKGLVECGFYHVPCCSSMWKCLNFMTALCISPSDITESYTYILICDCRFLLSFLSEEEAYSTALYLLYSFVIVGPFLKIQVSWDVMPCHLIDTCVYGYFSEVCLHFQIQAVWKHLLPHAIVVCNLLKHILLYYYMVK